MKKPTQTLPEDVNSLKKLVTDLSQKLQQSESKNRILTEQLRLAISKQFGPSTEKYNVQQQDLVFDEAESDVVQEAVTSSDDDKVEVPAHTRKKKGRVALPKDLPRVDVIHDISEDEKTCQHDGHALTKIGEEVSEQLEIIPAKIQVLRHVRYKYACKHCEQGVTTAKLPKQPIPKSIASPALLASVAVSKYQDALPLYRQTNILKRHGIELPRATLANWMLKCGELITPLINLMQEQVRAGPLQHIDETTVQVLNEPGKTAQSKSYMWTQIGGTAAAPVRLFTYAASRSGKIATELLDGYQGLVMTDGYEGYSPVCAQEPITQLACWAHVRRKFVEAQQANPKKTGKADIAISNIQKLYAIEKRISHLTPNDKVLERQQHSLPVLNKLKTWLDKSLQQVPPKTALGKALHYLNNQWHKLIRYVDHGHAVIDNNPAENAIRPFVVGRKNWLFANSVGGAKASANLYSIIETAKANQLEPFIYLKHIFTELPKAESLDDIEKLLPWNVKL